MSSQEFPIISQDFITKEEFEVIGEELINDTNYFNIINNPTDLIDFEDKNPSWLDQNYPQNQQYPLVDMPPFPDEQYLPLQALQPNIQQIPTNVEYDGDLGFELNISAPTSNNWNYSPIMKKCYLKINTTLPIDVYWKPLPEGRDLYLRAMPLFTLDEFSKELVQRCIQHLDPKIGDNVDVDPNILNHVLRCSNDGTMYLGSAEKNEHFNVLTPLPKPQTGVDSVRMHYKFMCKNSCPTGMNRRSIDVIFTLEDGFGQVYGRKKLGVRICSCPKRDKDKEEKEIHEKECLKQNENNENIEHPPPSKKKKLLKKPSVNENIMVDNSVITLPSFNLIGSDIIYDTLKFAQDRILAEMHRGRFKSHSKIDAEEIAKSLGVMMKDLKETAKDNRD